MDQLKNGFYITEHKGVRMTFANGWSISIQWGPTNYCENYDMENFDRPRNVDFFSSTDAEIAIFNPNGEFAQPKGYEWGDNVKGHLKPDDVLEYMNLVSKMPKGKPLEKAQGG